MTTDDVEALLEILRRESATCGDERPVRLEETHISRVLLGRDAYKIKKAVKLPFLDFRALERRREMCDEELAVNRRLASGTYRDVVPITRANGTVAFGGDGEIVDWAVRMVRLDERTRADLLLAEGGLSPEALDALAVTVAAFHAGAEHGPRTARFGATERIAENVTANVDAFRDIRVDGIAEEIVADVARFQLDFLARRRDLFERRVAAGAIRDGHGDLRLEHVFFLPDGEIEIIDAIEFDPRYRSGDVCADIAFLAMDLARMGRVDLAERFVMSYARASNDYDVYPLLDFYEGYRAHVRAKIAALAAADVGQPSEVRVKAAAEARRYLLLARGAGRKPLVAPSIVAVAGGIASGKSTLAERLSTETGAVVIDADRTRKHMLGLRPTEHADTSAWSGPYDPRFSEHVYAEVLRRAEAVLGSGRSVILDASFRTAGARAEARRLAGRHGAAFVLLECSAPREVCRERVVSRDRATSVSDGRLEVIDDFAARFEPIGELAAAEHVRIDTSQTIDDALEQAKPHVVVLPARLA